MFSCDGIPMIPILRDMFLQQYLWYWYWRIFFIQVVLILWDVCLQWVSCDTDIAKCIPTTVQYLCYRFAGCFYTDWYCVTFLLRDSCITDLASCILNHELVMLMLWDVFFTGDTDLVRFFLRQISCLFLQWVSCDTDIARCFLTIWLCDADIVGCFYTGDTEIMRFFPAMISCVINIAGCFPTVSFLWYWYCKKFSNIRTLCYWYCGMF